MIDLLYLTWNRREFTEQSFSMLLENTDWDLVRTLYWYDDDSSDRSTITWMEKALRSCPVPTVRAYAKALRSPVETMNHYLDQSGADVFAKIDSDIVVPPGWLERMLGVMDRNPALELLGMEASMATGAAGYPPPLPDPLALPPEQYTWVESSHIGGVGLMRVSAFQTRPRPVPAGRFGFTEWQHAHQPVRGWIAPDLLITDLSRLPVQPWRHLSWQYVARGWQRPWPEEERSPVYWQWWTEEDS